MDANGWAGGGLDWLDGFTELREVDDVISVLVDAADDVSKLVLRWEVAIAA